MVSRRTKKIIYLFLLPIVIVLGILFYYQFLYKSEVVDKGYVKPVLTYRGHRNIVTAIRFIKNDSLLVTSSVDSTIQLWNPLTGVLVRAIQHPCGISYMDASQDGKLIVTGGYDSKVRLWDAISGKLLREFTGHSGTVWTVAMSNDTKTIASSGDDAVILIWDATSGQLIHQLKGHKRIVWSVKFSPDGRTLASASFDYSWKLWQLKDGKLLWDNKEHTETVVDLAFSHDGKTLASTSDDKTIRTWDLTEKKMNRKMQVPEHVQAVAFSPGDKRIITGGRDKPMMGELLQNFFGDSRLNPGVSARLWNAETGELLHCFTAHANDVQDVAYSHNGRLLATASADKTAMVWAIVK